HVHAPVAVAVVVQEQRAEGRAGGLRDVDQEELEGHGGHRTGAGTEGSVAPPRAIACSARATAPGEAIENPSQPSAKRGATRSPEIVGSGGSSTRDQASSRLEFWTRISGNAWYWREWSGVSPSG